MLAAVRPVDGYPKRFILDVAAYAEGEGPPPPELEAALLCESYGPPWDGGFMAWPARPFVLMRAARNFYHAYNAYRRATDKVAWIDANPDAWDVAELVVALREGIDL